MNLFKSGTISHSVWRALMAFVAFALPLLLTSTTQWQNITMGSMMFFILHYVEGQLRQ